MCERDLRALVEPAPERAVSRVCQIGVELRVRVELLLIANIFFMRALVNIKV